jgi:hypothetical protein
LALLFLKDEISLMSMRSHCNGSIGHLFRERHFYFAFGPEAAIRAVEIRMP